jgi:hypothetical protein
MKVLQLAGSTDNTYAGVEKFRRSTYRAANPTAGTGIASLPAAATFDATEALMTVYNTASASGSSTEVEVIQPIMLRIRNTVTNTAATNFRVVVTIDNKNRWTSGGTLATPTGMEIDTTEGWAARATKATVYFGNIVSNAASANVITVASKMVRSSIYTAGEETEMWFGEGMSNPNVTDREADSVTLTPFPVYIGRECTMTVHAFGASQTGGSPAWEYELFYLEHPPTNVNA